ncbi:sensor histidine kinase [Thermicanus aegyptius]|uniref:sensor histidine kinase n=1 Tax=Thermicanus aegyptius TaxID=94009 RepID=UPI00041FDA1B|nr:ATP-binding protein [Thermicanus aegyptius]
MRNQFQLTLKKRMVLWNALLLILAGLFLVIAMNVFIHMMLPKVYVTATESQVESDPDPHFPTIEKVDIGNSTGIQQEVLASDIGYSSSILTFKKRIQMFSIVCLLAVMALGSAGAYYISKKSLFPVRQLADRIKKINANQLSVQLPVAGPDDELKDLSEAFNTMLQTLDRSFQQQKHFISNAAHEFRTPITVLQTNLEVVKHDSAATAEDYHRLMDVFDKTLSRMIRMINDLLVLAKDDLIKKEPIEIVAIMDKTIADLKNLADKHGVSVEVSNECRSVLLGNEVLLQRALSNLVENAILYNRPNGNVIISCQLQEDELWISISNTGAGIEPEHMPYIFEPFYRTDRSRTKNKMGAGLGLSIASSVVHKHGGRIDVHQKQGVTCFTVRFPLSEMLSDQSLPVSGST